MVVIEEFRGVRGVVMAEVTGDDEVGYTAGTPFAVAGVAEITRTVESSTETHYYDNMPAVAIEATGAETINLNVSAIPLDVLAKITGQTYVAAKGMMVDGPRTPKKFALGYIAELTDGTVYYVWRLKGTVAIPDETYVTKDSGTTANGQTIVYTGIWTAHKFTQTSAPASAVKVDTSVNTSITEETFFASVQTPDTLTA